MFAELEKLEDPRVNNYLFMKSHVPITLVILAYLRFVFKSGPAFMKDRNAYELKKILIAYNILQIVLNTILFFMSLKILPNLDCFCTPVDWSITPISMAKLDVHHFYTLLKFFDLLDSVLFVLRKHFHQLSGLHIYHHVGILLASWISEKYVPGGHAVYVIIWNSFVHALMYGYYLLTALDSSYKKELWLKKNLTILQIVQHCAIFVLMTLQLVNPTCTYPKCLSALFLVGVGGLIYQFVEFYKKTYNSENKVK